MIGYLIFVLILAIIFALILRWLEMPQAKKHPKEDYEKVCPKCGSIDIKVDFSNLVVWASGTPPKYRCNSCGYIAITFPEVEKDRLKSFSKQLKDSHQKSAVEAEKYSRFDAQTGYTVGLMEVYITASMIAGILIIYIIYLFTN